MMIERDLTYENNNIAYDYHNTEEGIKCKNYDICESVIPKWWFECKNNYLCTNCHMMFGTWGNEQEKHIGKGVLEFMDNIECPICIECKKSVSFPRCNHMVCTDCFKRLIYGDESEQPTFPYPNIEDDYYKDIENPKWEKDYPLIEIYNRDYDNWENKQEEEYENTKNLRLCPLCRA